MTALQILELDHNRIGYVPPEVCFYRFTFQHFYASVSYAFIVTKIGGMSSLHTLYLDFNKILFVPNEIAQLSKLRVLRLVRRSLHQLNSYAT